MTSSNETTQKLLCKPYCCPLNEKIFSQKNCEFFGLKIEIHNIDSYIYGCAKWQLGFMKFLFETNVIAFWDVITWYISVFISKYQSLSFFHG